MTLLVALQWVSHKELEMAFYLLYGSSLVASDESTHDDVLKQHDLKCSQQRMTIKHCARTHSHRQLITSQATRSTHVLRYIYIDTSLSQYWQHHKDEAINS